MSLEEEAIAFAKKHKVEISRRLTDVSVYPPSEAPITVFMAGSPVAGKTEYSKNLLSLIARNPGHHPVRIDSDEIRGEIPGYNGKNSSSVQGAVSIIYREMYERTLKNKQTVLLDGTFSHYDKADENIRRSLKRGRQIFIFYVYQQPDVAWRFTQAREKVEGRNIPKEAFVDQFFGARQTVEQVRKDFSDQVSILLVRKNYLTNEVESVIKILPGGPGLDEYLPDRYTKEVVFNIL
ncbi:MAG: zeta toxin family protein [Patescibacteria group bacterium]